MSIKNILDNKKRPVGRQFTIRLSEESAEIIDRLQEISGWTKNAIINDLIESHKSELEAAERLRRE